ncbi:MAG: hypothetical protein H0V94_01120, partial [Actinobacteria bacterium]|nr:hypothetical protein [Actinomycetota bacterium]
TGLAAFVGAGFLPFFPTGWTLALALAAALATVARPRAGLALALAAPILPLGNLSLGLALLYGSVATGWLALAWREPRSGLVFLAGPLLAPLGLIGLIPLAVQPARGAARRGLQALAAVAAAALAAGLRDTRLPFDEAAATPALAGLESPLEAARVLIGALPPVLGLEALALAAIAVAIPWATSLWRIVALGSAALAAMLLLAPDASAIPLVAAVWLTCAALAGRHELETRSN